MEQLNKVISVFILLGVAIFVLWLLLSRSQTIKNIFSGKMPLMQAITKGASAKATPTVTPSPKAETQSGFSQQVQNNIDRLEQDDNAKVEYTKGGSLVAQSPTSTPSVTTYPNTGTHTLLLPLVLLGLVVGKVILDRV